MPITADSQRWLNDFAWVGTDGALRVELSRILAHMNLPDTPENREWASQQTKKCATHVLKDKARLIKVV